MVDLRLLGRGAEPCRQPHHCDRSVTGGAFGVSTRRFGDVHAANRYVDNRAFQVKAVLLILAGINTAIFHLGTVRGMDRWDIMVATASRRDSPPSSCCVDRRHVGRPLIGHLLRRRDLRKGRTCGRED